MTKPEIFWACEETAARSRWLGQRAIECVEQGQETLEQSKQLLLEISRMGSPKQRDTDK
ncbi:hypothetical protein [Roseobacter sp. S98]|uniref:hypothetical protein n=1 Tax=Roseobacter algicola (ex Choi et al. 2025) (nom. illeg.) TaxID=3092138 RepID=UPI0035C67EB0